MDLTELKKPFPPAEVSWRVGSCGKGGQGFWAQLLAYIDNRNIMDRLDSVCGPEHWCNEFKAGPSGGVVCGISIEVAPDKWVTKWDGAENTDIEAVKGGLSDSMKRAANQWGIGRYLYDVGDTWADCIEERKPGYTYAKTKDGGVFYWAVKRDDLAKLGAPAAKTPAAPPPKSPAKPAPNNTLPPDPNGAFDHVGSYRKRLAAADSPTALDDLLDFLKKNKSNMEDEYKSLLREWFERAIETAPDNDRVKHLDVVLAKAKPAIGDPDWTSLGAALDRKYQRESELPVVHHGALEVADSEMHVGR